MKLEVIEDFNDKEAGIKRTIGNIFEAAEERAKVILAAGVAKAYKEPEPEAEEKPKAKRGTKKKQC